MGLSCGLVGCEGKERGDEKMLYCEVHGLGAWE